MILCEKPIAMNTGQGEEMCQAVEQAGVANKVWYNYRRPPAVTHAKNIIDSAGPDFFYRVNFLQDWTISDDLPQGGEPARPTFRDALETQKVCDAVLKSGANGQWETV